MMRVVRQPMAFSPPGAVVSIDGVELRLSDEEARELCRALQDASYGKREEPERAEEL